MNPKVRIERNGSGWFVVVTDERGVVTERTGYDTREKAREAATRAKRVTLTIFHPSFPELNNVQ